MIEMENNNIWMNKAELERKMHDELMHEQNSINHLDLNQKSQSKDEILPKSIPSNTNRIRHDQMRAIYEI